MENTYSKTLQQKKICILKPVVVSGPNLHPAAIVGVSDAQVVARYYSQVFGALAFPDNRVGVVALTDRRRLKAKIAKASNLITAIYLVFCQARYDRKLPTDDFASLTSTLVMVLRDKFRSIILHPNKYLLTS